MAENALKISYTPSYPHYPQVSTQKRLRILMKKRTEVLVINYKIARRNQKKSKMSSRKTFSN